MTSLKQILAKLLEPFFVCSCKCHESIYYDARTIERYIPGAIREEDCDNCPKGTYSKYHIKLKQ